MNRIVMSHRRKSFACNVIFVFFLVHLRSQFPVASVNSFLHGIVASIGLSKFLLALFEGVSLAFMVIQINEVDSSPSSSIVEFWLLVCPFLFFSILSGFPNFGPYFRPYMIWSRSRLNFCQSLPRPHKSSRKFSFQ